MNKEITIYELLGLMKDNKAPKKVKFDGIIHVLKNKNNILQYCEKLYPCSVLNFNFCIEHGMLNNLVEILDEENDEFLDMTELYDVFKSADDYQFKAMVSDKIDGLIINQRKIIERLNKDE